MNFNYFLQNRTILDNGYIALSPSASIVMPTYSRMAEGFLARCIDSVLAQTYHEFEFIIIDDGSVDGSQDLVTAYAKKDPRIVYVRHDENSGLPAVRTNEGIMLARADHVAFIFDDNIWEPEALSLMMGSMLKSPVDVLHANTRMIQDDRNSVVLGGWPLTIELLQYSNTIPNGAVLCSRSFFDNYGLYDPHLSLRRICDWDLWRRGARFGAKFRHLNISLGIELGPSSPVSLGNSVKMDYKVAFAYMTDESNMLKRTESLKPVNIKHYDVFDPLRIFPYIRNENEWKEFQGSVYRPFFDKHTNFGDVAPVIHNRFYENRNDPMSLNAYGSIFRDKKRALIICNRFTPLVEDWKSSFETSLGCITVTCAEWQASAFEPQELDYLIIIDCTALFLKPFVQQCHEKNVAIGYVVMHGMDVPTPEDNPLKRLAFTTHNSVWETFQTDIYFPHISMPWSSSDMVGVKALMGLCDQVFVLGKSAGALSILSDVGAVGLPYLPLKHHSEGVVDTRVTTDAVISFYLGDPAEIHSSLIDMIIDTTKKLKHHFKVMFVVFSECEVPDALVSATDIDVCLVTSDESLISWARHYQTNGLIILPDFIANQVQENEYFLHFIEDDLAKKGAALLKLSDLPVSGNTILDEEWLTVILSSTFQRIIERQAENQEGCRLTQFACAADSLLLKLELEVTQPYAPKIAVLLNSPLFAGSEAYGLLLARAFNNMGFEIITCVPSIHGYGNVSPEDINRWLKSNKMSDAVALNYGFSIQSFDYPLEYCIEHSRLFNEWLDQQKVSLLLCVGFIPDPLMAKSETERSVFMALFQPWGYPLEKMTFLRDKVAGILTDSEWAAGYWSRWLPPPVMTVPTPLVSGRLKYLNKSLSHSPICIAIGGTLQPRKRQIEAIKAIRELISEGYNLNLNIYGYELEIVSEYVRETKQLIETYQLGNVVKVHGLVDLEVIFKENHIILSTSLDESLPQTLLFAMSAGLIAVACPAGGIPEIVINGKTGYLTEGFSVADIKDSLKQALDNRQDWPSIQAQATTYLSSRHGELNVSKQLLHVLLEGLAIERSSGRRLFPLMAEQLEEATNPTRHVCQNQNRRTGITSLKRKLFERAKRFVGPYLSRKMKTRIMHTLHRLGLF